MQPSVVRGSKLATLVLLVLSYAFVTALWLYSEALLSSTIVVGVLGGVVAGLLGWVGVSIAFLARLPLLRLLLSPSARRPVLTLSSIALILSAISASLEGGLGYATFYLLASIAFGIVSAAVLASVLNDVDYSDWGVALVSSSIATYTLALLALIAWSILGLNLGAPLAVASAVSIAFLAYTLRPPPLPSITLKTVEVLVDMLSFRRNPEAYRYLYADVLKLALILGGLGAVKVSLLSTTIEDHGVNAIVALTAGSLAGSIIASHTLRPRIAMAIAIVATTITLTLSEPLVGLALVNMAITYSNLTVTIVTLENMPKAIYRTLATLAIATAAGAIIVGVTSLANPQTATSILTPIATLVLLTSAILTLKRGREWE
jgi:hypothetical protein